MTSKDQGLAGDLAAREREHFERAYAVYLPVTTRVTPDTFKRDADGNEYISTVVQVAWSMWCARALATPVATPPANTLGVALADSDWVNVVNAPSVLDPMKDKEEAVREAVKLTEARLKALNALATTATGEPTAPWKLTADAIVKQDDDFGRQRLLKAGTVICGEPTDATENAKLREALRPFANYACAEPCDCHNCKAREVLAASKEQQQ